MPPHHDHSITIRVPASSGNVGPGYDCMGVGLALYNRVTVTPGARGEPVSPPHPMMVKTARNFFEASGSEPFPFSWSIAGEIPQTRGLGSSVTLRLGLITALNLFAGEPLDDHGRFELCARLEGHPDNAGPGTYGGFVVSNPQGGHFRFPVDERLKFVLLIPPFEVATSEARKALPPSVPHREAAQNMANACMVTAAFATGEYGKLRGTLTDYLHQKYRLGLVPPLEAVIAAGTAAGALGGFLSGSGSTMACVTLEADRTDAIGAAMIAALPASDQGGSRIVVTVACNEGARRLPS